MKHRCKVCGKLDRYLTLYGKIGWHHPSCVFRAWQEALKEIERLKEELERIEEELDNTTEMLRNTYEY